MSKANVNVAQMFEYDDIYHSGHLLVKVINLIDPPKNAKQKKKKTEWTLEYFILLSTKHIVHFQPNTGFIDPFSKSIKGKAIDLMQAQVQLNEDDAAVDIPEALREGFIEDSLSDGFDIVTARHKYILKPKESSSEVWVEKITEVMFDDVDAEVPPDDETRDYGDYLIGYNDVHQEL